MVVGPSFGVPHSIVIYIVEQQCPSTLASGWYQKLFHIALFIINLSMNGFERLHGRIASAIFCLKSEWIFVYLFGC
jgi:hypothetical protein